MEATIIGHDGRTVMEPACSTAGHKLPLKQKAGAKLRDLTHQQYAKLNRWKLKQAHCVEQKSYSMTGIIKVLSFC